jgi:hypothetical protein
VKDGIVTADCPIGDYDMMAQFIVQMKNAVVAVGWSAAGSLIVFMINSLIVGLRVHWAWTGLVQAKDRLIRIDWLVERVAASRSGYRGVAAQIFCDRFEVIL